VSCRTAWPIPRCSTTTARRPRSASA
jgi:hypothetical protein